jgi:hypothetical protein
MFQKLDDLFVRLVLNKPSTIGFSRKEVTWESKMQKSKLIAIAIVATLLLSSAFSVVAAQQTPSGLEQSGNTPEDTFPAMAIGIISGIITVSLIGVLFFRKQN